MKSGASGTWLAVTPAFNEAARLPKLARSLAVQERQRIGLWVIVDDGSTDGTDGTIDADSLPFPVVVHRRENSGGLRSGSVVRAFRRGVEVGLERLPGAEFVMKIDADLELRPDFFAQVGEVAAGVGLIGGILESGAEKAQSTHVRGGLRAYNRQALEITADLPAALGWDIVDQVAVRAAGLDVLVVPAARATTSRRTGSSVGILAGRRRLGVASRWAGYHPLYFVVKLVRYAAMPPYGIGAMMVLWGYLRAGASPFPPSLRAANRTEQTLRLRALVRHPVRLGRSVYVRR